MWKIINIFEWRFRFVGVGDGIFSFVSVWLSAVTNTMRTIRAAHQVNIARLAGKSTNSIWAAESQMGFFRTYEAKHDNLSSDTA